MGHETQSDIELLHQLESSLNPQSSPIEELMEIGLLYLEPFHEEEKAVVLFKKLLERDSTNELVKLWLSYSYLNFMMDRASLREAYALLNSIVISLSEKEKASAYMLLAEVMNDLEEFTPYERKCLLEKSVELQPEWVCNRFDLAEIYKQLGQIAPALEHMQIALNNLITEDPSCSIGRKMYEEYITGRSSSKSLMWEIYNIMKREMVGGR